jgi:hypothetical protein
MEGAKDHGAGNLDNAYCKHCTDAKGELKQYAEKTAKEHLGQMPAWAKKD